MAPALHTSTDTPLVTAVICTFNRARYLRKAIRSLLEQTMSRDQYEIIIVDNNSTDNTRAVAATFESELNLRYIFEPVQGLCQARNTGLAHARGTYVAYLDDDGLVVPGWTQAIADSFRMAERSIGCVGGSIEVLWEIPRPDWISDPLLCYYGDLAYEKSWKYLDGIHEYVGGGNAAYPVALLKAMGGFDTSMGHKGSKIRYSEESILHLRMIEQGHSLLYNANMRIMHHAGEEKVNYNWLKRRIFWQGFSSVQVERRLGKRSRRPAPHEAYNLARYWIKRPFECVTILSDIGPINQKLMDRRHAALWALGKAYGLLGIA